MIYKETCFEEYLMDKWNCDKWVIRIQDIVFGDFELSDYELIERAITDSITSKIKSLRSTGSFNVLFTIYQQQFLLQKVRIYQ